MKILITDDHKIVREGLKQILQQVPGIERIEEAKNGKEAIQLVSKETFDIVILDISLPDISGLDVLQSIKKNHPGISVLMLSMYSQEQYAIRSFQMGASGYLNKDSASEELVAAVKKLASGGKYITSSLAETIAGHIADNYQEKPFETLSKREFEIMLKIAAGKSLKEIGKDLFISEKTVSTYRTRFMDKMGMKKNSEIIRYCIKNGLL